MTRAPAFLAELDRHVADTAGGSVHDHCVADADAGDVERVRSGCPDQQEPGGLLEDNVEPLGHHAQAGAIS